MFQGMEYVYEVYKEKSFSKAAASLFISQPSLSTNVRRVENRIGYPIFDRSKMCIRDRYKALSLLFPEQEPLSPDVLRFL